MSGNISQRITEPFESFSTLAANSIGTPRVLQLHTTLGAKPSERATAEVPPYTEMNEMNFSMRQFYTLGVSRSTGMCKRGFYAMCKILSMKKQNIEWRLIGQHFKNEKEDRKRLQEFLKVTPQQITNWKTRGCPPHFAPGIAEFFNVPVGVFFGEEAHQFEPAPMLRDFKDVPVVGTIQAGDLGMFEELEYPTGFGDGFIEYPRKDPNSYALRVRGDSMRPRIKSGEFIVVEPNYTANSGDDVAVTLKDGRRMVKELLYIRAGEVCLGSINQDHPNITVQLAEIEKMHYVAAIIPRGAFYKGTD